MQRSSNPKIVLNMPSELVEFPPEIPRMMARNPGTSLRNAARMTAFGEYLRNIKDYFNGEPVYIVGTNSWSFCLCPGFFPEGQTGKGMITYDPVTARGTVDVGFMLNDFDWVPGTFDDALWHGIKQLQAGREVP